MQSYPRLSPVSCSSTRRPVLRYVIHLDSGQSIEVLCREFDMSAGPDGGSHSIEFWDKDRGEFELPKTLALLRHEFVAAVTRDPTYRHPKDEDLKEVPTKANFNKDYIATLKEAAEIFKGSCAEDSFHQVLDVADYDALLCFISWIDNPRNVTREKDLEVLNRLKRYW